MAAAIKNLDMVDAIGQVGQLSPAMMGIPRSMLTNSGEAALKPGQQYQFDIGQLLNYQDPAYQNGASLETGQAPNDDAGRWFRFKGSDGTPLVAARNYGEATYTGEGEDRQYTQGPLTGYQVFTDPGDMGGGWLGAGHESAAMNGRAYDSFDAKGNYTGSDKFQNWQDDFLGPAGALAVIAMPFAAAAAGIGGAAAGAAGAAEGAAAAGVEGAAAAGAAGASSAATTAAAAAAGEGMIDLGGGIMMAADGSILGATPFATSALTNAGILESIGAGGLATGGTGALTGLNAVDLTGTGLPLDTAGSVVGSQAGGGVLTNAGIESIINGEAFGGLAGPSLTKAELDGTNVFGANSAPGSLDISTLSAAAPGAESADALTKITEGLGYNTPTMPPNPFGKTPWEEAMASPLTRALLNAGASTLVTSLLSGKKDSAASQLASVGSGGGSGTGLDTSMPDPLAQIRAAQNSVLDQLARRGRESTILTRTQ